MDGALDAPRDALSQFHPTVERWFAEEVGAPTDVQSQAWRSIARQEHVLITAPTGTGKTLAAFLWVLNRLIVGELPTGCTSVLYVSPLKALNNDIQRNLVRPLRELRERFEESDEAFPDIRVLTRSGDTPQSDRRRMQRDPPEILITTPESLNLLLASAGGRSILPNVSTVILDEIHGVVGSKRGTHLITAVERLARLAGEFQRIALSATVKPLETVAEFVGGYTLTGYGESATYTPRPVKLVRSAVQKAYALSVRYPVDDADDHPAGGVWGPIAEECRVIVARNRSTLFFTNSRRLCERLTMFINGEADEPIAYAHHGSLSREIRVEVERRLREGELRGIVATSSLELGIDIGALDEVVLVGCPPSVSSTVQRVGRAGHQVGEVSRASLFPTNPRDFIESAVVARTSLDRDIEETQPVRCPLDVLAQVLVAMVGLETWDCDDLFDAIRTSYPFRSLTRRQFNGVLNMLDGRYEDTRIRELKPRLSIDRIDNTVSARSGAMQSLYLDGGTIPDRGEFHLRHHETSARIGTLDEEFVWESAVGQTFTLGTQSWRVERITHNDVFVSPGSPRANAPFWRAEGDDRDFHFSQRIGEFMEHATGNLESSNFAHELTEAYCMDPAAAAKVIAFLADQRAATKSELPHRHHVLVETVLTGPDKAPMTQIILHTLWGGRVNRPYGMALSAAWEETFGYRPEIYTDNDCVVVVLPHEMPAEELLSLVSTTNVERLLRLRLESSGFFAARFRECAGIALLLARSRPNQRMPLWLSRLKAQKLLDAVMRLDDFPILLETWRACMVDSFDLTALRQMLTEVETGAIAWTAIRTSVASPLAQSLSWGQISEYMYMGDVPSAGRPSRLRDDLLRELVFNAGLRPTVPRDIVRAFEEKAQRIAPGYAPQPGRDLIDWLRERLWVRQSEWGRLLAAIERDEGADAASVAHSVAGRAVRIANPDAAEPAIVAVESLPRLMAAIPMPLEWMQPIEGDSRFEAHNWTAGETPEEDSDEALSSVVAEWLRFYGPVSREFVADSLGIPAARASLVLEDLVDTQVAIVGSLVMDEDDESICDSENFEVLLRLARAASMPAFNPLPVKSIPLFLASIQGIAERANDEDGLHRRLEQLIAYPARSDAWESDILPARVAHYSTTLIDAVLQRSEMRWVGSADQQVLFCYEDDVDLLAADEPGPENVEQTSEAAPAGGIRDFFADRLGRYDFMTLLRGASLTPSQMAERLWSAVWRGEVTNDTFAALRKGLETGFQAPTMTDGAGVRSRSRSGLMSGLRTVSVPGSWLLLPTRHMESDPVSDMERSKDRARIVLDRYGVVFRELLAREASGFRWSDVFRALRVMELSGEIVSGCFFEGVPGLQFATPHALHRLRRALPEDAVFWLNATDPASMCGASIDALRAELPKRHATTYVVYRGSRLIAYYQRSCRDLHFRIAAADPSLRASLSPIVHLLTRPFAPLKRIVVESINGQTPAESPYLPALRGAVEVVLDYKSVVLYRANT